MLSDHDQGRKASREGRYMLSRKSTPVTLESLPWKWQFEKSEFDSI